MQLDNGQPPLNQQSYLGQTLAALWDNLPQLVVAAAFLSLCAGPAFALAAVEWPAPAAAAGVLLAVPAWMAVQHFEGELLQGKATPLRLLLSGWRSFWLRSVRLGVLALFLPALTWLLATRLAADSSLAVPVATGGVLASLLVGGILVLYTCPLLALYDTDLPAALRNSLLLPARHINHTLGLVAMAVLGALATLYLSLGLLFVLPVLYGMFVANNCRLAVQLEQARQNSIKREVRKSLWPN